MRRYLLTLAVVLVATLVSYLFGEVLKEDAPLLLPFTLAVVVAGWAGGLRPGLLATAAALVVGIALFLERDGGVLPVEPSDQLRCALFLVIGVAISWLAETTHAARRHEQRKHEAARRAEEQARVMGEQLRLALTAARADVFSWDIPADEVRRLHGIDPTLGPNADPPDTFEAVLAKVHPDDRDAFERRVRQAVADPGSGYRNEYRLVGPDGSVRWIADVGRVETSADGRSLRLVGLATDVTERKQAEERLRASEERFRSLSESGLISIAFFTLDGRITEANHAFLRLTGHGREDVAAGRVRWDQLTPPEWLPRTRQAVLEFEATGRISPYEKEYLRSDGTRFWGLFGGARLGGGSEGVAFVLDITDQKRAIEALRDADRKKDEFLATLAHELRNPLAPLRNALQIMELAGNEAGAVGRSRGLMERQVEQMTRLVDDLMDVSRIGRGQMALQKSRMRLADAVRNAVDTSRPLIEQMGHELVVDVPPEPIAVEGDLTRLSQVFVNLLNNAAKYTDRGGRIRLTVERQGSDVVVSVADNGVGLPTDKLHSVFEMFAQVGRSLEKSQGGLGIGLNIVKRLVEMHGGSIVAESDGPGLGSTFTVRLPVLMAATAFKPDHGGKPPPKSAVRRRVLVVDDNADGAASLTMLLDLMGHETRTAHNGLEAVSAAEAFRPDVILMDLGMPKLNGYDACRRIREQPWGKSVLIVACSGRGQDEDKRKTKEAGFDRHLTKPVDPAELETVLAGAESAAV